MKTSRPLLLLVLLLITSLQACKALNSAVSTESTSSQPIKVLAIGNSFSQDAVEQYLFELAKAEGFEIIIGNLYIAGCSLETHWNNAKDDKPNYEYRKINNSGIKANTSNASIATALEDEDWDFISFQQVSSSSGIYDSYLLSLPLLYQYVSTRVTNQNVKYILHQTWAYSQDSKHPLYGNYNNNQMTMYNAIVDATLRAKDLVPIDIVVPAGTAIQNGRTSYIGDNFCSDGYHLNPNIGRYTASCTWFEMIFNISVVGNSFKPDALSQYDAKIAQQAAHNAVNQPNRVTPLIDYIDADIKSEAPLVMF